MYVSRTVTCHSCASVNGIPLEPTGQADALGERFPFSSHHFYFWNETEQGASSWKDGKSILPCQSFPKLIITFCTTSSLTFKSQLYISSIKGRFAGLLAYYCQFLVIFLLKRCHTSLMRVPPIPESGSLSLGKATTQPFLWSNIKRPLIHVHKHFCATCGWVLG